MAAKPAKSKKAKPRKAAVEPANAAGNPFLEGLFQPIPLAGIGERADDPCDVVSRDTRAAIRRLLRYYPAGAILYYLAEELKPALKIRQDDKRTTRGHVEGLIAILKALGDGDCPFYSIYVHRDK